MTDLEKLIEAVKADAVPFGGWSMLSSATHVFASEWARQAHNGSLDAARALHEALLPEWDWGRLVSHGTMIVSTRSGNYKAFSADNDNPARAWMLAVLMAYGRESAA